jgi:hypothetical protein
MGRDTFSASTGMTSHAEGRLVAAALKRTESRRFDTRERGYRELAALGQRQRLLDAAIDTLDDAALKVACEVLFPEPPALVAAMVKSGEDRYYLEDGNYLYAEREIEAVLRPRARRLKVAAVEACGLAYLRSMAPALQKLTKGSLQNHAQKGVTLSPMDRLNIASGFMRGPETAFTADAERAVQAAVALRVMDCPVDPAEVRRLRSELDATFPPGGGSHLSWSALLDWVSVDADPAADPLSVAYEPAFAPDAGWPTRAIAHVALTLLKRGQPGRIAHLTPGDESIRLLHRGFAFWPLVDCLVNLRLVVPDASWEHFTHHCFGYARARRLGLAPPPWWQWQSAP